MTGQTPGGNPLTHSAGGASWRSATRCGRLTRPGIAGMEAALRLVNTDAAPGMPPLKCPPLARRDRSMVIMRHTTTQALYSYWNGLRGSRRAPHRFEIEPVSMGNALPDTFILERQDAGTFPFRLAGTRLCELFKKEFRGHNFLDGWAGHGSATLGPRLNTISVQGGVLVILADGETASGKLVPTEILILPLVHGQACADRFLGVLSLLKTPAWLDIEPISTLHLRSERVIWPDGHPHPALDCIDDRQSPFHPRVRHARIVRSDRRQFRVFEGGLSTTGDGLGPKV